MFNWDTIFFNNSGNHLAIVCLIIIITFLFRKYLSRYTASLLYMPIQRKWKSVGKDDFIGLVIKPLGWFLSISISLVAIDSLVFPDVLRFDVYGKNFYGILHDLGSCIGIIFFIWVVQSFIDFIALVLDANARETKDKRDDQIIVFFRDFFKAIVYIVGLLMILKIGFGVDIGSLLTGLSIVGAALALAAKESIENLIASFIIFFDKPFYTGDTVKVSNFNGSIEHIGLRSTRIRTAEQTLITVPNKQMVDSVVDNWSMRTERRAEIKIELSHDNTTDLMEQWMQSINTYLTEQTTIVKKHSVYMTDYNKQGVMVSIEYFTSPFSMEEFQQFKQQLIVHIKKMLEEKQLKTVKTSQEINIFGADAGSFNLSSGNQTI